jgi:hypothetical protein
MKAVTGRTKRLIQALEDDKIFPTGIYSVREVHDTLVATGNLLDGDMKVASVGRYIGAARRWGYNDEHNHNARYSKNGAPFPELGRHKERPVAPQISFEEMSNNDMDRFKARSCATLQGVEQLLKAAQAQNERLSRMEDMLSKVQRIVGEHLEDATNAYGSEAGKLDAIFKLVKHLTDEFDGVKP